MVALPNHYDEEIGQPKQIIPFAHDLLDEQNENIESIYKEILELLENRTGPILLTVRGSMGSGKTTLVKRLNNAIQNAKILRLDDDRAAEGEIFDRNKTGLREGSIVRTFAYGSGLSALDSIISDLNPGDVLFLSEAQFIGTNEEIDHVIDRLLGMGVSVVCDCLSIFYNGKPVPGASRIKQRATKSFDMWACDSYKEGEKAQLPMRVVRIGADGSMPDTLDQATAHFYTKLSPEERIEIFKRIKESEFANRLIKFENGVEVCLVPSHPTQDDAYVPGDDYRYSSTNVNTCISILRIAGLEEAAKEYEAIHQDNAA